MSNDITDTAQARWARFRFSIVGPLLSAPPLKGDLKQALVELSKRQWKHPITGVSIDFSVSTLERWYYQIRQVRDPVTALRSKRRSDADLSRVMSAEFKQMIQQQYREHPRWSYQLHVDNLRTQIEQHPELGVMPSYPTIRRYMKASGFCKQRTVGKHTVGALIAAKRLAEREVRSFEVEYVHGLWHLDFHHGSRKILDKSGQWIKPKLLAIMDDRSRLICHMQWYWDETTESLVHGFLQALQKRGLPRAVMSDNESAMTAAEFTEGLERLSILHEPTLPHSPYHYVAAKIMSCQTA